LGRIATRPTITPKKGQNRMKLAQPYVHDDLGDPALAAPYASEAQAREMRTCEGQTC
jgi:hypothetical protein